MKVQALGLLFLLALLVPLVAAQEPFEPTTVVVEGPRAMAPGATESFKVTVAGGPGAENGTFQIIFVLQGENLAGGDPQVDRTIGNRDGVFKVNITAPEAQGRVVLWVRGTSTGEGVNDTAEARHTIHVAPPVNLVATLRNHGAAAALNVQVRFYVDDAFVGNRSVARIDAGAETEVSFSYVPINLGDGRHSVRIEADLNGDGKISPELGELVTSEFFYKTEPSNLPAILGTVTAFILLLLLFLALAIRRQRRLG